MSTNKLLNFCNVLFHQRVFWRKYNQAFSPWGRHANFVRLSHRLYQKFCVSELGKPHTAITISLIWAPIKTLLIVWRIVNWSRTFSFTAQNNKRFIQEPFRKHTMVLFSLTRYQILTLTGRQQGVRQTIICHISWLGMRVSVGDCMAEYPAKENSQPDFNTALKRSSLWWIDILCLGYLQSLT